MVTEIVAASIGAFAGFGLTEAATWLQARRRLRDDVVEKAAGIAGAIQHGTRDEAKWYLGELRPQIALVETRLPGAAEEAKALLSALEAAIDSGDVQDADRARSAFARAARLG